MPMLKMTGQVMTQNRDTEIQARGLLFSSGTHYQAYLKNNTFLVNWLKMRYNKILLELMTRIKIIMNEFDDEKKYSYI